MTAKRRVVVVVAAALAMAGTARLGFWQLDRAAQKVALHEARQQQSLLAPLAAGEIPRTAETARRAEHRRAVVRGRWLPEQTIYLDNRPMAGRVGFFVLTPLALDGAGGVLLVQRGFWPRDLRERTRIAAPAPPPGWVPVGGRIALEPSRVYELSADAAGPIRQNLDVGSYARETGLALLPWVLVQQDDTSLPIADDGLLRQWPQPAADVHKHYGYAVQWFALTALVAVLFLWFQIIRPRRLALRS